MADYPDHKTIATTLLEQQGTINDLREQLLETADVLRSVGKAAIVVKPALEQPYADDERWTPWSRWLEKPARRAYNLGVFLRTQQRATGMPHRTGDAATRLYDAARHQADILPGHATGCGWHASLGAYCSCSTWVAACAGVDAVLDALDTDASDGTEQPATGGAIDTATFRKVGEGPVCDGLLMPRRRAVAGEHGTELVVNLPRPGPADGPNHEPLSGTESRVWCWYCPHGAPSIPQGTFRQHVQDEHPGLWEAPPGAEDHGNTRTGGPNPGAER